MESIQEAPPCVFRNCNALTPYPVAYYRGTRRGRTIYVELSQDSEGKWWGVTVRNPSGRPVEDDPSKCCQSLRSALNYIASLPTT